MGGSCSSRGAAGGDDDVQAQYAGGLHEALQSDDAKEIADEACRKWCGGSNGAEGKGQKAKGQRAKRTGQGQQSAPTGSWFVRCVDTEHARAGYTAGFQRIIDGGRFDCSRRMSDSIISARAFEFAVRIMRLADAISIARPGTRHLVVQLVHAGTSIGANAEEAQEAQTKADFIARLSVSRKEARETHYW
jgi:hypothetical protein